MTGFLSNHPFLGLTAGQLRRGGHIGPTPGASKPWPTDGETNDTISIRSSAPPPHNARPILLAWPSGRPAGRSVSPRPLAGEGSGGEAVGAIFPRPLAGEGPGVRALGFISPRPLAGEGLGVRAPRRCFSTSRPQLPARDRPRPHMLGLQPHCRPCLCRNPLGPPYDCRPNMEGCSSPTFVSQTCGAAG
jgi:hypothetical protein